MIGETIGNFRIVSRLGRGGMGEVWLAEQQSIGTRVAVKLLLPEISEDEEQVQRFFNEARAVSRIQHAGIVKIFDVGFHASGHAYLVMEYLEGESLARRIRRSGRLRVSEVAELGRQIASVLEATHSAQITHRDLKPDNLFLVTDRELASHQRAKVLDFGIAKLSGTLAHISPRTIGTMGTPAYMAPEQWGDASRVDWRADIYALGCVAFEMTCGRPPFVVTTLAEACGKHLTEPPPRARELVGDIPPELDDLLAACLEKRPEDRPPSMEDVVRRFEAVAAIVGPPPAPAERDGAASADPGASTQLPSQHDPARTVATGGPASPRSRRDAGAPPRRRARRWLVPALGGALLVAAGAAAGMLVRGGSGAGPKVTAAGTPPSAPPLPRACAEALVPPALDGYTRGPVQLAYRLPNLQAEAFTTLLRLDTTVVLDGVRHVEDTRVRIGGELLWTITQDDKHIGSIQLGKLDVDREVRREPPGAPSELSTVRWRSEDPAAAKELAPLTVLLRRPISISVNARGQRLRDDVGDLQAEVARRGAAPELAAAITSERLFRPMFVEVPDRPIGLGDTFRGGEQLERLGWGAQILAPFELRVAAISEGGKQVLLQAEPTLSLDVTGSIEHLTKESVMQMWVLFDVERGDVAASAARACVRVAMDRDGQRVEGVATLSSSYQATLVAPGTPYVPPAP